MLRALRARAGGALPHLRPACLLAPARLLRCALLLLPAPRACRRWKSVQWCMRSAPVRLVACTFFAPARMVSALIFSSSFCHF